MWANGGRRSRRRRLASRQEEASFSFSLKKLSSYLQSCLHFLVWGKQQLAIFQEQITTAFMKGFIRLAFSAHLIVFLSLWGLSSTQ